MPDAVLPSTARLLLARTARVQRDGRAPGLVAGVVRDGGLAWSTGRGDVPEPHTDVQYRLGSISKTVTAVAVLRLRDEGRVHLDDPLDRHVPGTPLGDRTVGQLLAHVAGAAACRHPIRLTGQTHVRNRQGEHLGTVDTDDMPDGVIYTPCGNRRAAVCPPAPRRTAATPTTSSPPDCAVTGGACHRCTTTSRSS